MQAKQKQSRKLPASAGGGGGDPWSPWLEIALGLGAWWGCLFPPQASSAAPPGPAPASAAHPVRLALVHSSATVVAQTRKSRHAPPRLVPRIAREDA